MGRLVIGDRVTGSKDEEEFCSRCFAGVDSNEHHEKCVVAGHAEDGESAAWSQWDAERIADVLRSAPLTFATEDQLQAGIANVLRAAGCPVEREVQLAERGRIDLMCGRVGIEVKNAGQWTSVVRQLMRYTNGPELDALVLVTNRARHRAMPADIYGKRVHVVMLIEGGL